MNSSAREWLLKGFVLTRTQAKVPSKRNEDRRVYMTNGKIRGRIKGGGLNENATVEHNPLGD